MPLCVAPYAGLATIYDHVMRHVEYPLWADYLQLLLERFGGEPGPVAELACGTGSISLQLCARGLPVTHASDRSEEMLAVARERAVQAGLNLELALRDLRDLRDLGTPGPAGPFAAVVCVYDSLNYLLELEEVVRALEGVRRLLRPRGIFVFDVCTQCNSLRYFRDHHEQESGPGFRYHRHSYYGRRERLQVNDFTIYLEATGEPLFEHHEQRIYRLQDLGVAIARAGLELVAALDGFSTEPGSEASERVHFVARRPAAAGGG